MPKTALPAWYEELKQYTHGMPQIDEFPPLESPEVEPPSATQHTSDMSDQELADNYELMTKWAAFAEYAESFYAASEAAALQQLNIIKRQVYRELKNEQPGKKFSNVKESEILVDSDPRVQEAEERHTAMKVGHKFHAGNVSSYNKYAFIYAAERKDRREREQYRNWRREYDG